MPKSDDTNEANLQHMYIVQPYLDKIKPGKDRSMVLMMGKSLQSAVENLHSKHFVHLDIKSENAMFDPETFQVMLIDFDK